MSDFLRTLHTFQGGSVSRDQLLAEVDRQLAGSLTDPVSMLATLDEEPARTALPHELHEAIAQRILKSLGVAGTAAASAANGRYKDPDPSDTLLSSPAEASLEFWRTVTQASANLPAATEGMVLKERFELVMCVGEGGMGRVYKAIDLRRIEARSQDVFVAVKILTKSFSDYSSSLAMLEREAIKLQKLSHPNIVRVMDCDRDGATVFMIMEFLAGQSLRQRLHASDSPRMSREDALRVLERIADALAFAHRHDVIHGDLKPGNVIITDTGETKVIDFGVTRAIAGSVDEYPWAMTPSYASPEMLEHQTADVRDDVYGLACLAYEMLTGAHPFDRKSSLEARDAGMRLVWRAPLTRGQFKALVNALCFKREGRTPSVEQFMEEFRGERAGVVRWRAWVLGSAALIAAVVAHFLYRTQPVETVPAAGTAFRDCRTCPLMRVLAGGQFEQGAAADDVLATAFERPRRTVVLSQAVAFGVQEVTHAQFSEFVAETGRAMPGCASYDGEWRMQVALNWNNVGYAQSASHPAVCVSWLDATAYAEWLSRKTGHHYRLPTASEWEYAARAGFPTEQPWGTNGNTACASANVADAAAAQHYSGWNVYACNDGYVYTAPVGTFAANAFGLNDMLGNAFEWVEDC